MVCVRFTDTESAVQAFAWFTYDTEEPVAYAATQDTDDEEQTILDAACGAMRLRANLCAEMQEKENASAAAGWSVRAVARTAHPEVLSRGGPLGWAAVIEVDNEDSDDFDDDVDAPGITNEQRVLFASFESARRDLAGGQLMATERQALSERRATSQRTARKTAHKGNRAAAWGVDEEDDLMQRVELAVVRGQHRWETCEAATFRRRRRWRK
jgi:hypothetical protein